MTHRVELEKQIGVSGAEDQVLRFPESVVRDLKTVTDILIRHHAKRIILYGSFARGDFRLSSDLDLCVEEIPDEEYFSAWAETLMIVSRHVSILDLAGVRGYLRERILSEGMVLYAV
ncbi:MAG: nucleotidyltransferase domain-containing protein [Chloroflexi bacterium]|nr:nucleotidyltransferase domain-containing protein [Chloroflexota bacterium]